MKLKYVLVVNSGSSSFKYKIFELPSEKVVAEGLADRVGLDKSTFELKLADGTKYVEDVAIPDHETAVHLLVDNIQKYKVVQTLDDIVGVGHRVVAGGEIFKDSTLVDQQKLQEIFDLAEYAPLHNPAEAMGIKAFMKILPGVPEVAVFDTSFHQTLDPVHYLYSAPYEYYEKYRARKYGAHGTSVRYVSKRASEMMKQDLKDIRMIVCHLGAGASITAVKNGKSYDTSMGFTPLTGITMATRSGDIDVSLVQYIMHKENLDIDEMIEILNRKSGLLGISGVSSDMRDLEASDVERAKLARKIFINRVIRYIGEYVAELGGADAIVFTAGIGEHDQGVRKSVMEAFEFLGVDPDFEANSENGEKFITKPDSKVKVLVVPTDEELVIERDVVRLAHLQ